MHCTRHRVFLAVLICAAKYLNDSSPKNMHWQKYGRFFSLAEVNLMEKQLLYLLDYQLRVEEGELLDSQKAFYRSLDAAPEPIATKRRATSPPKQIPSPRASPAITSNKRIRTPQIAYNEEAESPVFKPSAPWSSRRTPDDSPAPSHRRQSSISLYSYALSTLHLDAAPVPPLLRRSSASSSSSMSSSESESEEPATLVYRTSQGQLKVEPVSKASMASIASDSYEPVEEVPAKNWMQASLRSVRKVVPGH